MEGLFLKSVEDLGRLVRISDEDRALLERVDQACDSLIQDEVEHYLEHRFNEKLPGMLAKFDLLGIPVAKDYGGLGAEALTYTLALERLGQLGMGVVTFLDVQISLAELSLQQFGSEHLKEKYLKPACKGEKILAYALTEPGVGSDPVSLQTTFKEERGYYLINGTKYLISNGGVCDALIVFAYPEDKSSGITAFLVDSNTEGFSVAMKLEHKIGLLTSDTAMLEFSNCKVPKENLLGRYGKGLHVAYNGLVNGRIGIGSGCLGVIEDCLNESLRRAKERIQHGKEIGRHQLIQKHIAQIACNWEMVRWPVYHAAMKKAEYDRNPQNQVLRSEADRQSALAKLIASRLACDSADHGVQVFGGAGYSTLSNVGRHFADTRVARIYEGTDEIMELKIASSFLGEGFEAYR